jgi:hypothetical protein
VPQPAWPPTSHRSSSEPFDPDLLAKADSSEIDTQAAHLSVISATKPYVGIRVPTGSCCSLERILAGGCGEGPSGRGAPSPGRRVLAGQAATLRLAYTDGDDGTTACRHTHIQAARVRRGELARLDPADARRAAQIMAVLFPSKELLGFPEKDCKVSGNVLKCSPAWHSEVHESY